MSRDIVTSLRSADCGGSWDRDGQVDGSRQKEDLEAGTSVHRKESVQEETVVGYGRLTSRRLLQNHDIPDDEKVIFIRDNKETDTKRRTNRTVGVGEQVSFPCEASHGATYFYRSWLRGYFSRRKKNATKLFHQIGDGDPERLPSGRSDMAVDNASFNMTIGVVQRIDGDVFTCYQYQTTRPLQYFYSYVYIHLKPEDSPLHNSAGLIVGICAGVIVLLLAAGLTVYTLKKWRETDTPVPSVSMGVSYDVVPVDPPPTPPMELPKSDMSVSPGQRDVCGQSDTNEQAEP